MTAGYRGIVTDVLLIAWIVLLDIVVVVVATNKNKWVQSLCSEVFSCDEYHMDIQDECFLTGLHSEDEDIDGRGIKHLGHHFHPILQWNSSLINSSWLDLELYGERTNRNGTYGIRHVHVMRQIPNVGHLFLPTWLPTVFTDLDSYDCMFHLRPRRKYDKHGTISEIYNFDSFFDFVENCQINLEITATDDNTVLEQAYMVAQISQEPESTHMSSVLDIEEGNIYYDIVDEFIGGAFKESSKVTPISEEERNQSIIYKVMVAIRMFVRFTAKKMRTARKFVKKSLKDRTELYCYKWYMQEKRRPPAYDDVLLPPCSLGEAIANPDFEPDTKCSNGRPYCQFFHPGAYHCVRSKNASWEGSSQQACYNRHGRLLDYHEGGGRFDKAHPSGYTDIDWRVFPPLIKVLKVWRISHFVEDVWPFLACCKFTNNCKKYFEVRPTQLDCDNYKEEYNYRKNTFNKRR